MGTLSRLTEEGELAKPRTAITETVTAQEIPEESDEGRATKILVAECSRQREKPVQRP